MKHFIFSSFFQSPGHFHEHRKDGACDLAQWGDVCARASRYLGVCLSQRCSCVHQKLAHGPVPLAGGLVQRGLTPKSQMKRETTHKGAEGGAGGGSSDQGVRVASYPCC